MQVSIGIGSADYDGRDWDELVEYTIALAGVRTLRPSTDGENWLERTAALEQAMDLIERTQPVPG